MTIKTLMYQLENDICFESEGRKGSTRLLAIVLDMLTNNRFDDLNYILDTIDFEKISTRCIGVLFRSCYQAKNMLGSYKSSYKRACNVLANKNIDSVELFKGMII